MNDWLNDRRSLVIAHRGASFDAPENSLSAFALAIEQGADGIEFDVQLSADGWPVIMHDRRVDRTTNGRGAVSRLTLAELQDLDAGDGRAVPTLDQVFEMFGSSVMYNVELKSWDWRDRGLEAAVADCIEGHRLEDRVIVSSSNPLSVRRCCRYFSRRTLVALIRASGLHQFGYLLAKAQADHPEHTLVDETYINWARRRGYYVNTWTVDDPAEARRLQKLGVHGIITNLPALIRQSL